MKDYLNYLLHELIPGLFKGTVRFCSETLTVVRQYFIWIIAVLAVLYFFDIGSTKRILDGIIEMIQALDKIAPGTANDDTLLYGVEVKFYNMEVKLDEHLETIHKGLYVIGDGSGVTHSLSHASASGVYVAREIAENK